MASGRREAPREFPMGLREFPIGPPEFPIGLREFPMGLREFPIGPRVFPIGPREFPIGPRVPNRAARVPNRRTAGPMLACKDLRVERRRADDSQFSAELKLTIDWSTSSTKLVFRDALGEMEETSESESLGISIGGPTISRSTQVSADQVPIRVSRGSETSNVLSARCRRRL